MLQECGYFMDDCRIGQQVPPVQQDQVRQRLR